ncbi:hypothetical protein GmHk_11G031919 [Glycine max]|nr:hypothetical protein GmHk_11G031914 [Glycine max]KAH1224887.1 hypothetical protein GmHk_11G031919 [Glycine max]
MNAKETKTVHVTILFKLSGESHKLTCSIDSAGNVKSLRLPYQTRTQLLPFSELIVEDSHCPKHDLLQCHSLWELVGVSDRETGPTVEQVVVVEDAGRGTPQSGEERKVVVVENSSVVVVLWNSVVQRKVCSVGFRECHLSVQSWIRHHACYSSGRGVGASQNVVHEK